MQRVIFTLSLVVSFCACNTNKEDIERKKLVNEGLSNFNARLETENKHLHLSIHDDAGDVKLVEKMKLIESKSSAVKKVSENIVSYIDGLIADVSKDSAWNNKDVVGKLFDDDGKGTEFERKLNRYLVDVFVALMLLQT